MSGLTKCQFCNSPANLAKVLGSIVGNMYKHHIDEKTNLHKQFGIYFEAFGSESSEVMTASTGTTFPTPDNIFSMHNTVGIIKPAIF